MDTLLEAIDVCDVDGFCYGNYTDEEAGTGCTVIVAPEGATGGVDVRGGAPASRETDLLRPENTVDKVHAVCLSGGSAFGLEAASGVARELESRGIGRDEAENILARAAIERLARAVGDRETEDAILQELSEVL